MQGLEPKRIIRSMRSSLSRPWLALTLLTSLASTAAPGVPDPKTFQKDMLTAHNRARSQAKPAPKPALAPLTWSAEAAKKAESYVGKCKFEHNPDRGEFGENLAAGTPGAMNTVEAVQGWVDEAADYNLARNTCRKGKVCGHYTQVVWRNTKAVGCATRMCTKNSPFGPKFPTWQLWVCNYTPPGNYIGQKPY
jgi:pathogenesis-related protein 1